MKINWKVRFSNPQWWARVAVAVVVPILTYFGFAWEDMTTWATLGEIFVRAVQNPVVVVSVLLSLWNTIPDPTTKGIGDSPRALSYVAPGTTHLREK